MRDMERLRALAARGDEEAQRLLADEQRRSSSTTDARVDLMSARALAIAEDLGWRSSGQSSRDAIHLWRDDVASAGAHAELVVALQGDYCRRDDSYAGFNHPGAGCLRVVVGRHRPPIMTGGELVRASDMPEHLLYPTDQPVGRTELSADGVLRHYGSAVPDWVPDWQRVAIDRLNSQRMADRVRPPGGPQAIIEAARPDPASEP